VVSDESLVDLPGSREVLERTERLRAAKWDIATDRVRLDGETVVSRDLVMHPGAVGIVALDDQDRVTLIRQYRHPVAAELWEIPAGLLDEPGESPLRTAQRELIEEVGLTATTWHTVIDVYPSPGMSSEAVRVFLARGLADVDPALRPEPTDEERDLVIRPVHLEVAVERVMAGGVRNSLAVVALLATARAQQAEWRGLLPADHPWPGPLWSGPALSGL
jgi:8-oxo-dGTP pyrophosphatase MutT (NUDIX family)